MYCLGMKTVFKRPAEGATQWPLVISSLWVAVSTGQRNTLLSVSNRRSVDHAPQTSDSLHRNRQGTDVGSLAEREVISRGVVAGQLPEALEPGRLQPRYGSRSRKTDVRRRIRPRAALDKFCCYRRKAVRNPYIFVPKSLLIVSEYSTRRNAYNFFPVCTIY